MLRTAPPRPTVCISRRPRRQGASRTGTEGEALAGGERLCVRRRSDGTRRNEAESDGIRRNQTENDDPQPQVLFTLGLLNLKPEPWSPST
ncbi:uncharacterized protein SOCEGT47_053210 [Sorangium cellulosum]|uniref:Uncharacterized protein n=1 Tax=Sorangium cellulosum TaxID=56 RepID=A0A4P2Q6C2_SORCE|nr:uncharacterized protein SOCEGT47_053210 [Sorangium cellulosum]